MSYLTAAEIPQKLAGEVLVGAIDCTNRLTSGETLGGTPTITASSSGLVISSVAVSTLAMTINNSTVSLGQAVLFVMSSGTAGELYSLLMSSTTSGGQTINERIAVRVRD